MFKFIDSRNLQRKPIQLSDKTVKSIENRQKVAALLNAKEKIEDYQNEVFHIIENDGLKSEDERKRLETAIKVLPYITPQKKATEITHLTKKIEDIIAEHTEEAEFIEIKNPENEEKTRQNTK